ncbi:hypothetical protein CcCBS67573_g03509 [Chytriomyces confervae]|uniref:DM10 domain-containing protein n=1 Tax=Chytriomyces confervae TaxID=246404 RepID=A0A507FG85_9FUNG|nr:hypothetical protein CcCBS67573_g03509 [Chytriomyces confervae]
MHTKAATAEQLLKTLPLLPGHSFGFAKMNIPNHRKSHAFDFCNKVSVFCEEKPGIGNCVIGLYKLGDLSFDAGGNELFGQAAAKIVTSVDNYPHSNVLGESAPAWLAFDRKVLRFYAYFQEAVHEKREEQYRVRRVNIYFYLEDDTIHVSEPKYANSGIPQGTLVRRHRIPKGSALNGQHYTISDLNVENEVTFYSRTFKIVGCDQFTREFLTSIHVPVPSGGQFPEDPYQVQRAELLGRLKATRPCAPNTSLKKFLENDRRVLRFYCIWDDTNTVFGDVRHMVVHYYLSDDTVDIHESIPANSGRPTNSMFLRRCRLPKNKISGASNVGAKNATPESFFTERDFTLGAVLHLNGRTFVICDCDDFTKEYYRENYGLDSFDPVRPSEYEEHVAEELSVNQLAKAAGVGPAAFPDTGSSEERKGGIKNSFRTSFDGLFLRYLAVLRTTKQVDSDRRFVISLYLADDSVSVFEPHQRNSGILGGKFLEKSKIKKPDGLSFYGSSDFFIGAHLTFHGHTFIINSADEYALVFMSQHPEEFPNFRK